MDKRRQIAVGAVGLLVLLAWLTGTVDPRSAARKVLHLARRYRPSKDHPASPAAETPFTGDTSDGFVVFRRSVMKRVLPNSAPAAGELPADIHLEAAWEQREAAQIAVHAIRDLSDVNVTTTALIDGHGNTIPASAIDIRMERFYSLRLNVRDTSRFGVVPKTLEPTVPIAVPAGTTRPWWITVHVPHGIRGGTYHGSVAVTEKEAHHDVPIDVDVLPRRLDEADAMMGPWSVPVLRSIARTSIGRSGAILSRADVAFRDIREHGMTSIGLWSGDAAHQTLNGHVSLPDLDIAFDLYKRNGFPQPLFYAPVNLLHTNKIRTTSNYRHYNAGDAAELAKTITREYTRRAAEAGIPGLIFAPIEEPNVGDGIAKGDDPNTRQRIAGQVLRAIKEAGGVTAMTCTPESARVADGDLDHWLVAYKKFDPAVFAEIAKAGGHAGLYANSTLMGNGTSFSRFFFGYYPWSQRLSAMMAWTYPLLPKRFPENHDSNGEGPLHVVDGCLGSDGKPVPVIQWELSREGVDDFRYVVTLSHLVEKATTGSEEARSTADEASAFLASLRGSISSDAHEYTFEDPRTFEPIASRGWDAARFEETRHKSFQLLKRLSAELETTAGN